MDRGTDDTKQLLRRVRRGERDALRELFARHRDRLVRMVQVRLDHRVQGRLDASDVLQEAYIEAWRRMDEYLQDPQVPFFLWLRFLTGQKLIDLHRQHLGARCRDARRELGRHRAPAAAASTHTLARHLACSGPSPSSGARREEMRRRVQDALEEMDPLDREVLSLRHFEQLSNSEAARELGLQEPAARKRYFRALRRLRGILGAGLSAGGFP